MNDEFDEDDIREISTARNLLIAYILNKIEDNLPIKLSDLLEVLDKKVGLFKTCMPLVEEQLKLVYGISMAHFKEGKSSAKKIICYSKLNPASVHEFDENQKRTFTLLFIILSYIYMMGNVVTEDQLENYLSGFKINFNESHPYFGSNLKKLITDKFVKQLYLDRKKTVSHTTGDDVFTYKWGFRSNTEFLKIEVLNLVAMILEQPPETFMEQLADARQNVNDTDEVDDTVEANDDNTVIID